MSAPTRVLRVVAAAGVTGLLIVGGGPAARWATNLTASGAVDDVRRATTDGGTQIVSITPDATPTAAPSKQAKAPTPLIKAKKATPRRSTLARAAERKATAPTIVARAAAPSPYHFVISSFNALGSNHTKPGGDADNFAPGRVRAGWAATLMQRHDMSVVGFQEIQSDQLDTVQQETHGAYDMWPGYALGAKGVPQTLMWRKADWTVTWKGHVDITFMDQIRPQPVVRLKNNATGREIYVLNVHMSPNDSSPGGREDERDSATVKEIQVLNDLTASGLPVFFVGDMNEHEEIFCKVTGQTSLVAAAGGSNVGGNCNPPRNMRVDWIFGSQAQGASFSNYAMDLSPLERQTTDHAVLTATVNVP
ncbi:MAG: endonuclease/exonuclease/phosphatase family protein [Nocardioides sp.]